MIMIRRLSGVPLVVLALALGGCATTAPYGNFAGSRAALDQTSLARDTARQLAALYPPARTRFALQHPTSDAFGTALVGQLRSAGYAVGEAGPGTVSGDAAAAPASAGVESGRAVRAEGTPTAEALPLRYVLDHDAGTGLYRLTLWVGTQSLARAYQEQNHVLVPAGYWVRKE